MELDEYIYGKFVKYFKHKKKHRVEVQNKIVYLETLKPKLTIVADAVSGVAIELYPAEREGGYRNTNFFLPASFSLFDTKEQNTMYYYYRVIYLAIQRKLGYNWTSSNKQSDVKISLAKALETSAGVLAEMFAEFPNMETIHHAFKIHLTHQAKEGETPDFSWLYGKWMMNDNVENTEMQLQHFSDKVKGIAEEIKTILKAKPVEEVISVQLDKKQQEDYVMTHNFEKVETAEEFNGVWRDFDGEDDLEEHRDALDELSMKYTVRTDDTAHSVYQSDFIENTNVAESSLQHNTDSFIPYDEWDYKKRVYKPDFCKVFPKLQTDTDADYYTNTLNNNRTVLMSLRKMLTNMNNKMLQQRRQIQGEEFDIDCLSDLFVDISSGHTPSERIYLSNRKKEKDISILLLLDISLSSDAYINGNRIIDIEKQVAILFGEIIHDFNIDFSIQCFYSKTRNYATYLTIKDFDEDWNKAKYKIGAISPAGFTRIGTALRHSGTLLNKRNAKNKWVILISDGKPNDYDRYEGKYGVNDVRQALKELKQQQVNSYALAIEATAKYYLPQMFSDNHYQIVSSPADLVTSLIKLYEKIKYQI